LVYALPTLIIAVLLVLKLKKMFRKVRLLSNDRNIFRNALLFSLVIHSSVFLLLTGFTSLSASGHREIEIEMIPVSSQGIGDDPTAGTPMLQRLKLSETQAKKLDQAPNKLHPDDISVLQKLNIAAGNDIVEGDDYGEGGTGADSGKMISGSLPMYPAHAREQGLEGSVVLRLDIASDGSVSRVTVRVSSGYAPFDEAAERAVRKWRFRPVYRNGVAIARKHDIRVKFRLNGIQ
jgi:TonB family protein